VIPFSNRVTRVKVHLIKHENGAKQTNLYVQASAADFRMLSAHSLLSALRFRSLSYKRDQQQEFLLAKEI